MGEVRCVCVRVSVKERDDRCMFNPLLGDLVFKHYMLCRSSPTLRVYSTGQNPVGTFIQLIVLLGAACFYCSCLISEFVTQGYQLK